MHVSAEYLPVIARVREATCTCGPGDALPHPQQGEALLYAIVQHIFKQCHMHVPLEESAAFAFADADAVGNVSKRNILIIVSAYVRKDIFQPFKRFGCLAQVCRHGAVIAVNMLPDGTERDVDLQLIIWRRHF